MRTIIFIALALAACGDNYSPPIEPDAGKIRTIDARDCMGDAGCAPTCEALGCTRPEYAATCEKPGNHNCVCHDMTCDAAPCCDPTISKTCDTSGLPLCGA